MIRLLRKRNVLINYDTLLEEIKDYHFGAVYFKALPDADLNNLLLSIMGFKTKQDMIQASLNIKSDQRLFMVLNYGWPDITQQATNFKKWIQKNYSQSVVKSLANYSHIENKLDLKEPYDEDTIAFLKINLGSDIFESDFEDISYKRFVAYINTDLEVKFSKRLNKMRKEFKKYSFRKKSLYSRYDRPVHLRIFEDKTTILSEQPTLYSLYKKMHKNLKIPVYYYSNYFKDNIFNETNNPYAAIIKMQTEQDLAFSKEKEINKRFVEILKDNQNTNNFNDTNNSTKENQNDTLNILSTTDMPFIIPQAFFIIEANKYTLNQEILKFKFRKLEHFNIYSIINIDIDSFKDKHSKRINNDFLSIKEDTYNKYSDDFINSLRTLSDAL